MAIKDGNWAAAQWLALVPLGAAPSAVSRNEEVLARRVAHSELRKAELKAKLHEKRSHF